MSEIEADNNAKEKPKPDLNSEVTGAFTGTGIHSLVGEIVEGKYRVLSQLGSGGMGAVYKAEHSLMDRIVAVKVLHPHLVDNEDLLRRFQHEARVASKLTHPNAVSIYDFGVWRAAPYLVMEYVEGETLKEYRLKNPVVNLREIQTIFVQVCSALAQAHDLGIVHRDLKPDNIMLTREKNGSVRARVLDFGIAKVLSEKALANQAVMTQAGTFFGTPKYASPEQVLEKTLDGRSDIYAIGIILYELLSGQVPFDAPSLVEIIMKLLNEEAVPLRKFKPELHIPAAVDELVMKCLEKKPADRFQSMHELQGAITELSLKRSTSRRVPIAILAGLAAAAVAAFFITQNWKPSEPVALVQTPPQEERTVSSQAAVEPTAPELQSSSVASVETPRHGNPFLAFAIQQVAKAAFGVSSETNSEIPFGTEFEESSSTTNELEMSSDSVNNGDPSLESSSDSAEIVATSEESSASSDISAVVYQSSSVYSVSSSEDSSQNLSATSSVSEDLRHDLAKIEDGKKEATVLYNAGRKLLQSKRYAEAAQKFEQAVERRPDAVGSYISLGNCYLRLGRNDRALAAFQSAVKNDPSYGPSHYNLAAYFAVTGDNQQAIASLGKALKLDSAIRSIVKADPDFAALRNTPEFTRLLER